MRRARRPSPGACSNGEAPQGPPTEADGGAKAARLSARAGSWSSARGLRVDKRPRLPLSLRERSATRKLYIPTYILPDLLFLKTNQSPEAYSSCLDAELPDVAAPTAGALREPATAENVSGDGWIVTSLRDVSR